MRQETLFKKFNREIKDLNKALNALDNEVKEEEKNVLIYACLHVVEAKKLLEDLRKEESQ